MKPNKALKSRIRIFLVEPRLDDATEAAALDALRNDRYLSGENVYKFEEEFARYIGTRYAVSTSSGTSALTFGLMAIGVIRGESVATTPMSFVATSNSIIHAGGVPKFVDISETDFNFDPRLVSKERRIPKVLLPVHLFGYPCRMSELIAIASENKSVILEDACQAHGAQYYGKRVGSIGLAGCFSFYPSKNLTVFGDGGMLVTDDEHIANLVRKLRDHGRVSHYEHDMIGFTSRLSSVNAAMGRVQLRNLDLWNSRRKALERIYHKLLAGLEGLSLPPRPESGVEPAYHLYVVRTRLRDSLNEWLEENGVQCGIHYPIPIHLQPVYQRMFKYRPGQFPVSENFSKTCLSLPIHQYLSDDDVTDVCELVHDFFNHETRGSIAS